MSQEQVFLAPVLFGEEQPMILILSNDGDLSCDLVQNWLKKYDYPFLRINAWDFLTQDVFISIVKGQVYINLNGTSIDTQSIRAIWFRKYGLFRSSNTYKYLSETNKLSEAHLNHLSKEFHRAISILPIALRNRKWLTDPHSSDLNKLEVLIKASECGLHTPETYISNRREGLKNILKKGRIISKSALDPIIAAWGHRHKGMMYTVEVTPKDIRKIPEEFLPSMVQELILKDYEVRVFYINGQLFSMSIYSQKDTQTKLDFRQYNWDRPNRMVPCTLPEELSNKIRSLMSRLNLNCGSIDLIKATDGRFIFLEVNPTGQFGMVDFPCNYNLHKIVAEELIKMDKDETKD